jgi:tetratricopeptide (TPR) repeat protein
MRNRLLWLACSSLTLAAQIASAAGPATPMLRPPMPLIVTPVNRTFSYQYSAPTTPLPAGGVEDFKRGLADLKHAAVLAAGAPSAGTSQQIHRLYVSARNSLETAAQRGSSAALRASAWNDVAYVEDKLGRPQAALRAAEQALRLDSAMAAARENRGEALLGLNRVDEAKQAYVELFPTKKALASLLLRQMQQWIAEQRYSATTEDDGKSLDALQQWVHERGRIAGEEAAAATQAVVASTASPDPEIASSP